MTKNHVYMIGVSCTVEQMNMIKKFCSMTNQSAAKFAAEALLNEIDFYIKNLPQDKKQSFETLLNG